MTIQDEILKLRSISNTGLALVDFVRSIHPKGDFSRKSKSCVYRPITLWSLWSEPLCLDRSG